MILFNDFPNDLKVVWGASDTETFTYIDNVKVTENELKELGKIKEQAYFREHASVRVWAWQFSDGRYFFVTNDFDEYINFLSLHKVKSVWFYNAKFDFAQIDYQLLTHNPIYVARDENDKKNTPWTYSSLHNDKGSRFSLKIWTPFKGSGRKNDRHTRTHSVCFYDFCNIFGGGLKKLLQEFNVKDFDGADIRKSTMGYQNVNEFSLTQDELNYLKNDTLGLYHLIRTANITLKELTGYEISKAKPDIMTAGGLAKKVLLNFLYPKIQEKNRKQKFQDEHPITIEQDKFCRKHRLYAGGLCLLNENYQGQLLNNISMHRYDVNSEYPFIMSEMQDIYGNGFTMKLKDWNKSPNEFKNNHIMIYCFDELHGKLKENMLPVFRNGFTGEYEKEFNIDDDYYLIFENEFNELLKWYDIDYNVYKCIVFKTRQINGYKSFVDKFYTLKNESKKNGEKAKTAFAKLILNSSYGKLSERPFRFESHREINAETGAVHLVRSIDEKIDENSMLSIIQGAYVTSSARVWILSHIREICKNNPAKNLIYCDTDSIHTLCEYDKADNIKLGGFKDESPDGGFNCVKYIAPKCYFDSIVDGETIKNIDFHSKGLNLATIIDEFCINGCADNLKPLSYINNRFSFGEKFQPLSGMNIRGGKALIPIEKYLAMPLQGLVVNGSELIEP